jgi:hypothetical protein
MFVFVFVLVMMFVPVLAFPLALVARLVFPGPDEVNRPVARVVLMAMHEFPTYQTLLKIPHTDLERIMQERAGPIIESLMRMARPLTPEYMEKRGLGAIVGPLPTQANLGAAIEVRKCRLAINEDLRPSIPCQSTSTSYTILKRENIYSDFPREPAEPSSSGFRIS